MMTVIRLEGFRSAILSVYGGPFAAALVFCLLSPSNVYGALRANISISLATPWAEAADTIVGDLQDPAFWLLSRDTIRQQTEEWIDRFIAGFADIDVKFEQDRVRFRITGGSFRPDITTLRRNSLDTVERGTRSFIIKPVLRLRDGDQVRIFFRLTDAIGHGAWHHIAPGQQLADAHHATVTWVGPLEIGSLIFDASRSSKEPIRITPPSAASPAILTRVAFPIFVAGIALTSLCGLYWLRTKVSSATGLKTIEFAAYVVAIVFVVASWRALGGRLKSSPEISESHEQNVSEIPLVLPSLPLEASLVAERGGFTRSSRYSQLRLTNTAPLLALDGIEILLVDSMSERTKRCRVSTLFPGESAVIHPGFGWFDPSSDRIH